MLRIISSNLLRAGGTGKRVILLVQHKGSCGETLEIIANGSSYCVTIDQPISRVFCGSVQDPHFKRLTDKLHYREEQLMVRRLKTMPLHEEEMMEEN